MSVYFDKDLAKRIEELQVLDDVAYVPALARLTPGLKAHAIALMGGQAICIEAKSLINRGVGMGLQGPVSVSELDQLETFFSAAGQPAAIELCPLVDASLIENLGQRGYRLDRFYSTYVRPISKDETFSMPPGINIRVINEANLEQWVLALTGYFDSTGRSVNDPLVALARAAFYRPHVTCFLATIEGQTAGGGVLSMHDGLGTLSFMRTRPEFRGRGVQLALSSAGLATAAANGCEFVTGTTDPDGPSQRNAQRVGGLLAYTKVYMVKSEV